MRELEKDDNDKDEPEQEKPKGEDEPKPKYDPNTWDGYDWQRSWSDQGYFLGR